MRFTIESVNYHMFVYTCRISKGELLWAMTPYNNDTYMFIQTGPEIVHPLQYVYMESDSNFKITNSIDSIFLFTSVFLI